MRNFDTNLGEPLLGTIMLVVNMKSFYSDINWVIMDYLVSEGYPGAAEKFAQETNPCQPSDIQGIRERVRIRSAIQAGRMDEAVGLINEVDPEVSSSPARYSACVFHAI